MFSIKSHTNQGDLYGTLAFEVSPGVWLTYLAETGVIECKKGIRKFTWMFSFPPSPSQITKTLSSRPKMDNLIQNQLVTAAVHLERQLDAEINRIDALDTDDLQALRDQRLKEMKKLQSQKQQWLANGHGEYSELADEKEFFEVVNGS